MKKTLFALGLALLTAASAWAQTTFTVNNLKYRITDETAKTVELTGYGEKLTGVLDIPATVVYETIRYTVTNIAEEAFYFCTELTQVNIPEGVTGMGYYVFDECYALTQVNMPASLTSIGENMFSYCTALTQVNVDTANTVFCSENGILFNKDKTTLIHYPAGKPESSYTVPASVTTIGENAFCYNTALTQINLHENINEIGSYAFQRCAALATITLPDNLSKLGKSAFRYCTALTTVTLPPSLKDLKQATFYMCTALTTINIPRQSIMYIRESAFEFCSSLTSITIPASVDSIEDYAFKHCLSLMQISVLSTMVPTLAATALENVDSIIPVYVPSASLNFYKQKNVWKELNLQTWEINPFTVSNLKYSITDIGTKSVKVLGYQTIPTEVEMLNIPSYITYNGTTYRVTSIESNAFKDCNKIGRLNLTNVTHIGENAFRNCTELSEVHMFDTKKTIGDWAFAYCTKLSVLECEPGSMASIGTGSFCGTALTQVTIPNTVTTIGDQAFNFCNRLKQINIGNGVTDIGGYFTCDSLMQINVSEANTAYSSEDGVLFNKDKTKLLQYPIAKTDTAYTLPNSVKGIESWAFGYCEKLKQITLPKHLTDIEMYAFFGCKNLTEMTVLAIEPPAAELNNTFYDISRDIPVYVPAEALADYQAHEVWSEFNLKALPATALHTPSMPESIRMEGGMLHNPQGLFLTLYNIMGQKVYSGNDATLTLNAGVYVMQCEGASCKVLF